MNKLVIPLFKETPEKEKLRVAAYARVSTGKDSMLHSLANQVEYYSSLINSRSEWEFVGIYTDEAVTGTKSERKGFSKLIADAKEGKIDLIITKSISRFARNTVTLLETIREFKLLNIDVYFEEQRINTLSGEGELLLSILASVAQEESRSVSENLKWRIRKNFELGLAWNTCVLGYKLNKGVFEVIPEEAEIVKLIYALYQKGNGTPAIAKELNRRGLITKRGHRWSNASIRIILTNYLYTGNLLLQRFYKDNHINKVKTPNNGELRKFHAEETHEAIIDLETFNKVQEMMSRKADSMKRVSPHKKSGLTGKLICANCGCRYHRRTTPYNTYWICGTYSMKGKEFCQSKQIPEAILFEKIAEVLNLKEYSEEAFNKQIDHIIVKDNNKLEFHLKDGVLKEALWVDKSRSLSWTPEMKERARQTALKGHRQ